MNKKALIVVTSNERLGNTKDKTGWYLSEVSHIYYPLVEAGFIVDFASPKGGEAPMEENSRKLDDPLNKRFVEELDLKDTLETIPMSEVDPEEYQVVHYAGGHGTMWDFPDNEDINLVTSTIYQNGGIVSAVCHGPAAFTGVKLSDGKYLVEGKEVSSFTDAEEKEVKKDKIVPFLLESKLREIGAKVKTGKNWADQVVVSERLITGQNPQSAASVGKSIVRLFNDLENSQHFFGKRFREEGPGEVELR